MKIIVDNKIPFIEGRLESIAEVSYLAPEEINRETIAGSDVLMVRTRTKCNEKLLKGSTVKLVVTATIGMDHIDAGWCEANGIKVRNAAGCNAPGVAQYVWASLLEKGFEPEGKTLGVVGVGNIGSIVARWGEGLGCKVLLCDPPREKAGKDGRIYHDLEYVLRNSDAVTFHTPLTFYGENATYHMAGSRELAMMKDGAFIVNAARGGVIDEKALEKELKQGRLKALIDVWEGEPNINRDLPPLCLVATQHIAGYSRQGKERATRMALEAVEDVFGVKTDTSGLEKDYSPDFLPSKKQITDSFSPAPETRNLLKNMDDFENIRESYIYRDEILRGV